MIFSMMARNPLAPVFRLSVVSAMAVRASPVKLELHSVEFQKLLILLHDRALGSVRILIKASLSRRSSGNRDRKSSYQLRDQTIFHKILRKYLMEQDIHIILMLLCDLCIKSNGLSVKTGLNDLINSLKCSAADEQDIRRINLDQLLMRMLSSALRRYRCNSSLYDLKKRLLHTSSPETSLVIDGFSDFLVILSISSI